MKASTAASPTVGRNFKDTMIQAQVVIGLHHLKLETGTSFKLIDNVLISNDKKILDKLFSDQHLKNVIGLNEIQSIYDNGTFFYINSEIDVDDENFNDRNYLINILALVQIICQSLWFIKDNSITSEFGHLIYKSEKRKVIHSNIWYNSHTNCFGKTESRKLTKNELLSNTYIVASVFSALHIGNGYNPSVKSTSKASRLARGLYFLQSARSSEDIGTKIAHYCSVLESVFSVSNSELKHRLSETVALFLCVEKEERLRTYKVLQNAYDIRSSIVHGDVISEKFLKNDFNLLKETVESIDKIIRDCFIKIFKSESLTELFTTKTKEDIIIFMQGLIFD